MLDFQFSPSNKFIEALYKGVPYYAVIHIPTNHGSMFEHDDRLLDYIRNHYEDHRKSLTPKKDKKGKQVTLAFGKSRDGTPALSLAPFLFSEYNGVSIEEIREKNYRVEHKYNNIILENGLEDCRRESLVVTHEPQMVFKSRTFEIMPGNRYVSLTITTDRGTVVEKMSYHPELLDILAVPRRFGFIFNAKERVQVVMRRCGGKNPPKPYLSVILAAYKAGMLDLNRFEESVLEAMKILKDEGESIGEERMTVDHFNSDIHNHCDWNLSIVSNSDNIAKKTRAGAFSAPYQLFYAIAEDKTYLVSFRYPLVTNGELVNKLYKFKTIKDFNHWCALFWQKNGMTYNLRMNHVSADGKCTLLPTPIQLNPNVKALPRDFMADSFEADILLDLYRRKPDLFEEWKRHDITLPEFCAAIPATMGIVGQGELVITKLTPEESEIVRNNRKKRS